MSKPWFKARRYGWGWRWPNTWQGWVVLIAYIAIVLWDFLRIDRYSHSVSDTLRPFFLDLIFATIALFAVASFTGEKPKLPWGVKDGHNK